MDMFSFSSNLADSMTFGNFAYDIWATIHHKFVPRRKYNYLSIDQHCDYSLGLLTNCNSSYIP